MRCFTGTLGSPLLLPQQSLLAASTLKSARPPPLCKAITATAESSFDVLAASMARHKSKETAGTYHHTIHYPRRPHVHQHDLRAGRSLPPLQSGAAQTSGWFKLPAELKNAIYRLVLVREDAIVVCERGRFGPRYTFAYKCTDEGNDPPLLRVCREIRTEALAIFYGCNVFQFAGREPLALWLRRMGEPKRKMLRDVRGFQPARWIRIKADLAGDVAQCRELCEAVESFLEGEGVPLRPSAFRTCFAHRGLPAFDFWVNSKSCNVRASEGYQHTAQTVKLRVEGTKLKLVRQ